MSTKTPPSSPSASPADIGAAPQESIAGETRRSIAETPGDAPPDLPCDDSAAPHTRTYAPPDGPFGPCGFGC